MGVANVFLQKILFKNKNTFTIFIIVKNCSGLEK